MQDSGPRKKTRRGGKSRARKLLRDERWRLQQEADAESEAELVEPTEEEKQRTWNQTQLLTHWASGELVAKPPPYPPPAQPPKVKLQPTPKRYTAPRLHDTKDLPPAPKYKPTPPEKPPPPPPGRQQQASSSSSSSAPSKAENRHIDLSEFDLDTYDEDRIRDFAELRDHLLENFSDIDWIRAELHQVVESSKQQKKLIAEREKEIREEEEQRLAAPEPQHRPQPAQRPCGSFDLHRVLDCWGPADEQKDPDGHISDIYLNPILDIIDAGYSPVIISYIGLENNTLRQDAQDKVADFNERLWERASRRQREHLPVPLHLTGSRCHNYWGKRATLLWHCERSNLTSRGGFHVDDAPDICDNFEQHSAEDGLTVYRVFGGSGKRARHPRQAYVYYSALQVIDDILSR